MSNELTFVLKTSARGSSPDNPILAGDDFSVAVEIIGPDGKVWTREQASGARWGWAIKSAPPQTVSTLFGHYSPSPGVTQIGLAIQESSFDIIQSGELVITGRVDGIPGFPPEYQQDFNAIGYIKATKLIGWSGPTQLPVEWVTPEGQRVRRFPEKPVTRWLTGYGPVTPEPEPEERRKLVVGVDIPSTHEIESAGVKLGANLKFGGFIDKLFLNDVQCIEDGQPGSAHKGNGTQVQIDAREEVYPGSAIPGKNFVEAGILFPNQGGSAQHRLTDAEYEGKESTIYEFDSGPDRYRVLTGMQWYSALREQNPPDVYLSDWLVDFNVRMVAGHIRVDWSAWHEGVPRKVISVVAHCHLLPSVFQNWTQVGNRFTAHNDDATFKLSFEAPTANRVIGLWHQDWRIYKKDKRDFGKIRPENATVLHFKCEQVINRTVAADEVFSGHFYLSDDITEAIRLFEDGGDPVPDPDPNPDPKNALLLDINKAQFRVTQAQFSRAFADGVLVVDHYDGISGQAIYRYQGTAAKFNELYPEGAVDPDPEPDPDPNPDPPVDDWEPDKVIAIKDGKEQVYVKE